MNDSALSLTPAAKQALDEFVEDYRQQIILRARDSASSLSGSPVEISLHDVVIGIKQVQSGRILARNSLDAVLRIYVVFGALMTISGAIAYFFQGVFSSLTTEQKLAALVAFSGLTLSTISLLLLNVRRRRVIESMSRGLNEKDQVGLLGEFVSQWAKLELSLRDRIARQLGESKANQPISSVMYELAQRNVLSEVEIARLREILNMRNEIVHRGEVSERDSLVQSLSFVKSLEHKLRTFESNF